MFKLFVPTLKINLCLLQSEQDFADVLKNNFSAVCTSFWLKSRKHKLFCASMKRKNTLEALENLMRFSSPFIVYIGREERNKEGELFFEIKVAEPFIAAFLNMPVLDCCAQTWKLARLSILFHSHRWARKVRDFHNLWPNTNNLVVWCSLSHTWRPLSPHYDSNSIIHSTYVHNWMIFDTSKFFEAFCFSCHLSFCLGVCC